MHFHIISELVYIVRNKQMTLGSIVHIKNTQNENRKLHPDGQPAKRDACSTWTLIEIAIIVYRMCCKVYLTKW